MKLDDGVNGAIFIALGSSLMLTSLGMPRVAHIDFGPGLLPGLVGVGFCFAGAVLLINRLVLRQGAVPGLVRLNAAGRNGVVGGLLVVGCIFAYVLLAETIGFLLLSPVLLFVLIFWFERRIVLAATCSVTGTIVFHLFFYQLMTAPLPWGVLLPWAGVLTW